jgi:hypothetical protein
MMGFIAGEQDTPGAPWCIRMTDELRALLVDNAARGLRENVQIH